MSPQPAPALPGWLASELPFSRFVLNVNGHAMHYIDAGEGPVVLLQHGNPTWCFLWRKVIALLVKEQVRVIAPDLIGLGLSDKPRDAHLHTLDWHASNLASLVEQLDLNDITLGAQDWGGPISAVMASRVPERIHGAVFANTSIQPPPDPMRVTAFHQFANRPIASTLAFKWLNFPLPVLHKVQGDPASIGKLEKRAYRYPLRHFKDRTAPLALARMVPIDQQHPSVATLKESQQWAQQFTGPVALVWGKRDPILGKALGRIRQLFPNAPVTETGAGHFLQEEVPQALADAILKVVNNNKTPAT